MIAPLLALALSAPPAPPAPPVEAPAVEAPPAEAPRNSLELNAGVGAGAGLLLVAPYAGPGLGVGLGFEHRLGERGMVGAQLKLDLGFDSSALADYGALGRLGYHWVDNERVELGSEVHAGVGNVVLLPLPLLGVAHHLTLAVLPPDLAEWKVGAELSTDLLLILPSLSGDVWTSVAVRLGWLRVGLRGTAGYGVLLPVEAGVSATARAFVAATF